jgi:Mor family transcriptional regulator
MTDDLNEPFELEAQSAAELAETLVADRSSTANWPKTLVELIDVNIATLIRKGFEPIVAEELARHLVVAQSIHNGGRPVYLPRGKSLEKALMHDAVFRASRRGNTDALARQYGLTCRAIEQIVANQTRLHRQRIQPSFPFDANTAK